MNLRELRTVYLDELTPIYDNQEAISIFFVVAEHVTGRSKSSLLVSFETELSPSDHDLFIVILQKLKMGSPLQYILGEALFYNMTFKVSDAVLIPRPETEELVDWIISDRQGNKPLSILDIGTGSGCIAIALEKNLKSALVSAIDISQQALEIAKHNALHNKSIVNFIHADILDYIDEVKYDIIVSNPPYITTQEKLDMHDNVISHEPHIALFVDHDNPLLFYNVISDYACTNLNCGGRLFFEINEQFGQQVLDMLSRKGFSSIELRTDMQGKARMVACTKDC